MEHNQQNEQATTYAGAQSIGSNLLTVKNVAAILQVAEGTVYSMVARKEIPHVYIGRLLRFKPEDINGFINAQTQEIKA